MKVLFPVLLGLALVFAPDAIAAPAKPKPRPKLGLVLSGGGARGAAHIGVIEVLEELRVPVDLVTGTSMGSVVGGLYAAGLSPQELGDTIQSVDWVKVFDDKTDRQDLSFRRKQDDRTFLTNLRLGFKNWSLFIPSGIVEGQKLDFLLRSMTLDGNGLAQIENLPLPFRAVATDIVTGEAVVFDHGPLAVAQRASMSIPAAFSPVVVNDRVLVDGYVANNLPIDVAQELGAKAIIAVDATDDLYQDDVHFMDGGMHVDSWEMSMDLANAMPGAPGYVIDEALFRDRFDTPPWMLTYKRQQRDGPFWDRTALKTRYESIKIPTFVIGGWYDGYRDSVPRMLQHLKAPVKAIVGPWSHFFPHDAHPQPRIEWRHEAVRWYDQWLKTGDRALLDRVLRYNEDDVRATLLLRDWLGTLKPSKGRAKKESLDEE